ncbi:cellulose biosynthesis cyclic di-GMP-binding regulatory protein BcsB [uncultured Devosia sp.]|uniref:cellulose biosynthesis cyclic di-GMP-binding regulatory protein BcsB n=1 Tax=uncultured Devosia sp. TaxID=211434 RepID=UPI0035CBAEA7
MKARLTLLASLLMLGSAHAQPAPFDMSPEAGLRIVTETPADPVAGTIIAAPVVPDLLRYVVPERDLRLTGENDRRGYEVYLTAAQAAAPASLHLGYLNALVVAPESSRLRVEINGTTVLSTPIASSAQSNEVVADVPEAVLKPGFNTVVIRAEQRHRTDCDISSTYELWSDIDTAGTYLAFTGARVGTLSRLDDMAAVGVDASGITTIRLTMPERNGIAGGIVAADLVQALAHNLRVPNPRVEFASGLGQQAGPGVLNVVVATAAALPEVAGPLAAEAVNGPVAAFAQDAANTLILSGPDWNNIAEAVESVRVISQQYPRVENALPPRADRMLPVPILEGNSVVTLESLGVDAFSFNGRRYRTSFNIALPSDFYANRYGQAEIRLNAAYSGEVEPGSQIEVFVNGQIASVTPILRTDDALRDLLIKVPMVGFRPGVNTVELVASLRTQADDICAPGTVTVGTEQRLLVSGQSEFALPDFARIAQVPNLAAFAGTTFPYGDQDGTQLVLGSGDDTISSGLTLLARMAAQTNATIKVASVSLASPSPAADAIFVGAYNRLPPDANDRIGILQPYASAEDSPDEQSTNVNSILQRWRSTSPSGSGSFVRRAQHWVADLLNLGPNSLGVFPPSDSPYAPRQTDQALVLQRLQPEGGLWTMLTVPDQAAMAASVDAVTADGFWTEISGRVSVLPVSATAVTTIEPNEVTFFETTPWTPQNIRFIAANWLSSHVLAYALLLGLAVLGLTAGTAGMLRNFGRRT